MPVDDNGRAQEIANTIRTKIADLNSHLEYAARAEVDVRLEIEYAYSANDHCRFVKLTAWISQEVL